MLWWQTLKMAGFCSDGTPHHALYKPKKIALQVRTHIQMTFIPASLDDFEELARKSMAPGSFAYYSTGSSSESTLRRNREAFEK